MTYDQQCTRCMTNRTFQALTRVVDHIWDLQKVNYEEARAAYGDMVNQPRPHIFEELKRVRKYTEQFLEEIAKSD